MQQQSLVHVMFATVVIAAMFSGAANASAAENRNVSRQAQAVAAAEELEDHVDEAEDRVESLLDSRRALTTNTPNPRETTAPATAATTLIVVPESEVRGLIALLDALSTRAPKPVRSGNGPYGDLRAHIDKAQEIARELAPAVRGTTSTTGTTGTTGTAASAGLVTVDRTALERLEIEIDAMERVLPRALSSR